MWYLCWTRLRSARRKAFDSSLRSSATARSCTHRHHTDTHIRETHSTTHTQYTRKHRTSSEVNSSPAVRPRPGRWLLPSCATICAYALPGSAFSSKSAGSITPGPVLLLRPPAAAAVPVGVRASLWRAGPQRRAGCGRGGTTSGASDGDDVTTSDAPTLPVRCCGVARAGSWCERLQRPCRRTAVERAAYNKRSIRERPITTTSNETQYK